MRKPHKSCHTFSLTSYWTATTALSVLLTLSGNARAGLSTLLQFAPFALVTTLLFVAIWVAVIVMITRRQGAAKFLAAGLIAWTGANLLLAFPGLHRAGLMRGRLALHVSIYRAPLITRLVDP